MTDQNPTQTPVSVSAPTPQIPPRIQEWKRVIKSLFLKFYLNKKIFWPISISFGLIFLIILLGLVFKSMRSNLITRTLPTPTPSIQQIPTATESTDILITSQNKLNDLKNQINNLDVHQGRLQPPVLDFNIRF